ncbi:MAG TPA: transcriptional repressor [Xanthomonadales bacterium]|nr:transcriptional repressor [Xanthomonadales bacterium]
MVAAAKSRPHEHRHEPTSYLREVSQACDVRGLKLTPLRLRVLELIAREKKPIKAYDLLDRLRSERDGAAPPTVYRALDFLMEHGFIHRLASVNAYTSCHHPSERHTVPFFICDVCAGATELCDQRVSSLLVEQARAMGFTPEAQTLEVHGVCARCSRA